MAFKTAIDAGYEGLNVPMYPADSAVITQTTASSTYDVLTIRAAASATGSWLVCADSDNTQRFAVTKNAGIAWRVRTTRPTTGLVKGEMFIAFHGSTPKICICTSTAGQTVKQVRARTKTFGRLTA